MDKNSKPSQTEVLAEVAELLPNISPHMELDRLWVWYCGPTLAGEANKITRAALKELGFRFAPQGHPMPNGKTGSWAHHCTKPIPRRNKGGGGKAPAGGAKESADVLSDSQLMEALGL